MLWVSYQHMLCYGYIKLHHVHDVLQVSVNEDNSIETFVSMFSQFTGKLWQLQGVIFTQRNNPSRKCIIIITLSSHICSH